MNDPAVVAVMGSCLTRDNFNRQFNPEYKNWFAIGPCTNQSSLIALMAPPVDTAWEPAQPMAPYGLWNVESDLTREILGMLKAKQPAYVVLDFFGDVHFGALETADGRIVTNNRWKLHKTDLHPRLMALPGTRSLWWQGDADKEEFLTRWKQSLDSFRAFMAQECPATTVIVHRGFNIHHQVGSNGVNLKQLGGQRPQKHATWARESNQIWDQLDTYASEVPGWESIDLAREWWTTYKEHPWGPFDVHYTPDYYGRFLAELHAIDIKKALSADDALAVDEVRFATRRRVRAEIRFWRKLRTALAQSNAEPTRRFRKRRPQTPDLTRPEAGTGRDVELLAALAPRLTAEQHERLATLPSSADAHIERIRTAWRPRIDRLLKP
jgi:hypothetical protein